MTSIAQCTVTPEKVLLTVLKMKRGFEKNTNLYKIREKVLFKKCTVNKDLN